MARDKLKISVDQLDNLRDIVALGGELLKHGQSFESGGIHIASAYEINGLRKKKLVRVDIIGGSVFAVVTEAGRTVVRMEDDG